MKHGFQLKVKFFNVSCIFGLCWVLIFLGEIIFSLVYTSVYSLTFSTLVLCYLLTLTQKCGKTHLKYMKLFWPGMVTAGGSIVTWWEEKRLRLSNKKNGKQSTKPEEPKMEELVSADRSGVWAFTWRPIFQFHDFFKGRAPVSATSSKGVF